MKTISLATLVLLASVATAAAAAPKTKPAATKPAKDEYTAPMDYGPFLSTSVSRPDGKPYKPADSDKFPRIPGAAREAPGPKFPVDPIPDGIALKGIVIPAGPKDGPPATLCFDTDALRMAGGWTGGWLDLTGTMLTNHKGISQVTLEGKEQFHCDGLGWGVGPDGPHNAIDRFQDPRVGAIGPLPSSQARYKGLYVHRTRDGADRVVLSYAVAGADVLELPGFDRASGAFTRTIRLEKTTQTLWMALCDVPGATTAAGEGKWTAVVTAGDDVTAVHVVGSLWGARLRIDGGRVMFMAPPHDEPELFTVVIAKGAKADLPRLTERVKNQRLGVDPAGLCAGGARRWKPIEVKGQLGAATPKSPAYVVDTLTTPDANPWHSWMRFSGLDFFADGRAAVCTLNGDVWVVSGIDDTLDKLTWTRFATGLYHPMGLRVVDDKVYVRGRDQITRLHDLNADGEADFYENFDNEGMAHPSYHGFVFDLQTDPEGNLYYARGGIGMHPNLPGQGRLIKVSKDGKTVTTLATGLRAPNGLGMMPAAPGGKMGWVTVSDNQGNWVPSSKIHLIDPNRPPGPPEFLGFLPHHHLPELPTDFAQPLLWLPHKLDNSSGGQAYVSSEKWGPYQGQWVHTSFGSASLMLLLPDQPDAADAKDAGATAAPSIPRQAAVVKVPLTFATGIMRPRFNPKDGQLYLTGVGGGWQTSGTRDAALYRVRHTGTPGTLPSSFRVVPGGIRFTFPAPLDRDAAADEQNYSVEQWNYKWTEKYGSPEFSAKDPAKAARDAVEVKSVTVSDDGRAVTLNIPDLKPVMQMMIQYNLKSADGAPVEHEVYATINRVPTK